ncbi:MAG: dienelactone hydrolase family protein [Alphaproteobacteria bacterium]|nr:dienelactone hydrolase family protein [Alphaproteobacteria bacterium]
MARTSLAGALLALIALGSAAGAAAELGLPFTLTRPPGEGPFPAVVMLHDCSGLGPRSSGAPFRWAAELTAEGYVTLWPDSFTTRGRPQGVCTDNSPPRITFEQRAQDAHAARAYLRALPFVDAARIAVMGGSHGGATTLFAIVAGAPGADDGGPGFAAAVALYPNCGRTMGGWTVTRIRDRLNAVPTFSYAGVFAPRAPLLILAGELDDWTPAEPCRRLVDTASAAGHKIELIVYPDTHHGFDSAAPLRFNPDRLNGYSPTGRGATTGGNPAAWADAVRQVSRFLTEHLRSSGPR